ncbi:hypothetical protein HMPREF9630_00224 [Peptoanaerobacter stomatis]|uniref:HNH endonuclease domain protein n=1 Tax=Peptoanaerobacter stomatis TaxID=796937 RepID=V9HV82_9FIRM|nr:hypothetical protein [Peptoanaerobacter stomatis]EHL18499.1 hypothetical protein HMPREF9630_00224 [Peptoanaerobacter stomatis]
MLTKHCKCGAKIPQTQKQCYKCQQKSRKERAEYHRFYDKNCRKNTEIYHSKEWETLTKLCKNKFNGLDIYAYYKYNRIVKGTLSHHIIEIEEDISKAYDINNLIYLSEQSHRLIHKIYRSNEEAKRKLQKELIKYVNIWGAEGL